MEKITLHNLKYNLGAIKKQQRVGRGYGSKKGETAGKGNNGNKQRSGFKRKWGFEGGQTPLYKRMPIIHHINNFVGKKKTVTMDMLSPILKNGEKIIDAKVLERYKIIKSGMRYKIVAGEKMEDKFNDIIIKGDGFSKQVKSYIEDNGGKVLLNKDCCRISDEKK